MKTPAFFIAVLLLLLVSACGKRHAMALVERNCTGTYLKMNEHHYKVCNSEKLKNFSSGEMVEVNFRNTYDCSNEEPICFMLVEYDCTVEILSVH